MSRAPWNNVLHPAVDAAERPLDTALVAVGVRRMHELWNISTSIVRRYCSEGRIHGAILEEDSWLIPEDAAKPERKNVENRKPPQPKPQPPLVKKLRQQKTKKIYHGLYDYIQTNLTYSNGRMASNRLMLLPDHGDLRDGQGQDRL